MIYSDKLTELREEKNMNQINIAKVLEIDNSLYAKYEKEYEIIPIKHLNNLCNYFNVSLDYTFGFTNKKEYKNSNPNIDKMTVGQRLKEFRKDHKLTQKKLASILNTVQPVVTNYENGKHLISTPFLYTICKKYHISADYLLGKIDEKIILK